MKELAPENRTGQKSGLKSAREICLFGWQQVAQAFGTTPNSIRFSTPVSTAAEKIIDIFFIIVEVLSSGSDRTRERNRFSFRL